MIAARIVASIIAMMKDVYPGAVIHTTVADNKLWT
jgi:hypothetical protein